MLNMKHDEKLDVSLEDLNKTFHPPLDDMRLQKDINHVSKTTDKDKYDKKYFLNGWPTWCSQICGAKPNIDAKSFSVVATELVDKYIYVRNRGALYETETYTFVDKENFNDYWATFSKREKKPIV